MVSHKRINLTCQKLTRVTIRNLTDRPQFEKETFLSYPGPAEESLHPSQPSSVDLFWVDLVYDIKTCICTPKLPVGFL